MEAPLLPIEIVNEEHSSIINSQVYQYPEIGSSLACIYSGKFGKFEVVDVLQMVSVGPDIPPRVLVVVRHLRDLNI